MPRCRTCNLDKPGPDQPGFGICYDCADTLGVIPMPPPRRPPRPCTRCNGMRFVRAIPREYTADELGQTVDPKVAPMALTAAPRVWERVFFRGNSVQPQDITGHRYGVLETYVCRSCGFVEWYCLEPDQIPIGPEYMTDVVNYDSEGPYR